MNLVKYIGLGILVLILIIISISIVLLTIRAIKQYTIKNNLKIKTKNGIDKMKVLEIGGIKQQIYIRGEDINLTIL